MKIEIIHIGDELLTGEINPYPTQMIQLVREKNASINMITILRDDKQEITDVLRFAERRGVDLVIMTGGLGPTLDDVTRYALADFLGVDLEIHQEAVGWLSEAVERMYGKKPVLTDEALRMATIPKGTIALKNITGAACGIEAKKGKMTIFCLPGFPREMIPMFETYILSRIEGENLYTMEIRAWRGETTMEPLFNQIVKKYRVKIASLPDEQWRERGNRVIVKGEKEEVEKAVEELKALIEKSKDAFIEE
ncbi:MAG: molybdopterin-binding protein [Methanomassiliicoccales archaeon]|jgi:nicotinamide-nucleotide amidase|nr:molybdopterin-binding protein [Methanomassiliicoccales archaeon]